jgi:hypothetical protein
MSEPVVKHRPTVDLDQYERRLRDSSHPHSHEEDPLAELARLVGEQPDPYGDVFAQEARPHPAAYIDPRDAEHHSYDGRQEPAFGEAPPVSPRLFGDFAAIEAGLRGSNAPHADPHPTHDEQGYYDNEQGYAPADENAAYQQAGYAPAAPAASRSRRPVYAIAATIAVAVIGIGTAFALKSTANGPGQIKTIMAAAGPTKIQPPADAVQDQNGQDASVLGQAQPAPTKLVNHEEQPVDLAQTVQDNAARDAASASAPADAASVPVPLSPSQVQQGAQTDGIGGFGLNGMPAPKKVKVVSVRPDGTILPNDQPPAAAAPRLSPSKTSDHVGPVAKASTPKSATPKTTSRVVTTPKTIESAANDDGDAPAAAPAKPAKKAKPQRMASADSGAQEATDAVAPKATSGNGSFAVQLAAPGSEAEAKAASSKLGKKYADALGGHHLGFHKAESNGKSVYRVRVSSLSKEDAVSLCEKLKAGGGSCFVAKN